MRWLRDCFRNKFEKKTAIAVYVLFYKINYIYKNPIFDYSFFMNSLKKICSVL